MCLHIFGMYACLGVFVSLRVLPIQPPEPFTVPEGHIYIAHSQFTGSPPDWAELPCVILTSYTCLVGTSGSVIVPGKNLSTKRSIFDILSHRPLSYKTNFFLPSYSLKPRSTLKMCLIWIIPFWWRKAEGDGYMNDADCNNLLHTIALLSTLCPLPTKHNP